MLFCLNCNNLLQTVSTADELYFKCILCQTVTYPTEKDTLRYETKKGTDLMIYRTILQTASEDPVNPKVKKICPVCQNTTAKQIRLGSDMRLINTCIKCKKQWIEGFGQK